MQFFPVAVEHNARLAADASGAMALPQFPGRADPERQRENRREGESRPCDEKPEGITYVLNHFRSPGTPLGRCDPQYHEPVVREVGRMFIAGCLIPKSIHNRRK